ncbi:hypothetical protein [Pseudoalteromonas piscicida]|uniref:Uncharacterized protein n=1 Tax=Pseudoalteromonas piscicida TaxID=43662 RepID=A0A2A5JU54_PSEO7|nr:hypothetical protein [Pseudoalteromonas piscicida]PCK32948.1 hypothetical protein CEX98_04985 [Pseudoalteromonas piscicida]
MLIRVVISFFMLFLFRAEAIELISLKKGENFYYFFENNSFSDKYYPETFIAGSCEQMANICPIVTDKSGEDIKILTIVSRFDMSHSKRVKINRHNIYGGKVTIDWLVERFTLKKGSYKVKFRYMDWDKKEHIDSNEVEFKVE